ncbi:MAG: hypothetical protein HKN80_03980 [Acidimicrobiia bacterium]|nr:hypothetical protein [Acidimicrobiia bacterium]
MDYVYGVLPSSDGQELLVLPADSALELAEIMDLLRSHTWGDLRAKASPDQYRELLEKSGYGEFAELAAHLPIGSGVREALEFALSEFDPRAVPPADGEPFDPHRVATGAEFPPDAHHVQNLHVAPDIVDRWGERYETAPNLPCVMLRADGLRDVVQRLEADGHTCREDADLIRAGIPDDPVDGKVA